ncbi:MAG TPA: IniB N-terminal domain-containing protein [Pseudonocardiaceae bacterium]
MSMTLHGFASTLLSDPQAMAAYELDPQGELARCGLDDITPQDVQEIMPLVTEFSSAGILTATTDTVAAGGAFAGPLGQVAAGGVLEAAGPNGPAGSLGLSTPQSALGVGADRSGAATGLEHGEHAEASAVLTTADGPSAQVGAATPDGGLAFTADEDGPGGGGRLLVDDAEYAAAGGIELADGPAGNLALTTPDGTFGLRLSEDGLDVHGDASFSALGDLGDSLDNDALDLAGGAGSVAGLLAGGADLGPALVPTGDLGPLSGLGGFGDLTGGLPDVGGMTEGDLPLLEGVPMDQLPTDRLPLDELPAGDLPVGELPTGLDGLPLELPQLPLDLPTGQLPELPVQLPQLPVELPSVPANPVTDTLAGAGLPDVVSSGPVGDLLGHSARGDDSPAGDLTPLDLSL